MKPKIYKHTNVRHKKEGYEGWIHETTEIEGLFTGNKKCEWQYSIKLKNGDIVIAPEEDLEIILNNAGIPPYLDIINNKNNWGKDETLLHKLGYQITGMNYGERCTVLINVVIPMLGICHVIYKICMLMGSRMTNKIRADQYDIH